jgi:TetR/AcrR family transcriptional repressor of nem operon
VSRSACRDKILDAAVQAVHERGYNGCGVQDITDAAGVPKGSFYNHFESKEALGAEVLDRYWQNRGCVALRVLSDESLSPILRLRRYFASLAEGQASSKYRCGCLVGNMSAELSDQSRLVRDRLSSVLAGWTRALETCIREAQRGGEIRADLDARIIAGFLVDAWQGAILRTRVEKDGSALENFQTIVFAALIA